MIKSIAKITVLAAALLASACTATNLEFDRMTGTAFPQDQTVSGDTVNLESIYLDAGRLLIVQEDDINIAPLTGATGTPQNCISNAELDSLMSANRSSQIGVVTYPCGLNNAATCTRYQVYGIVVDHFGRSGGSGACSTTLIGRMWRTGDRSAFAIFYKNNTVQTNGMKYLRSAAHEIGHALNLHHDDGDGSQTIMNQTSVVGNSFTFEFSTQSQTHLDDHRDVCANAGTGGFGEVNATHAGWTGAHGSSDPSCM
ncbi:hypothetical protein [Pelagibius marinus]|uniref:hypothetical protein n=1 Tax=Pelagibius marinus TaxID=2762760 RepID=UPI001872FA69|nr:hypothetical protein [Pelagibius marinus]